MRFPRLLGLLSLALLLVACGDTSASDTPPAPTTRSASQATSAPLVPQPTALPPTSLPNPTAAPAAPAATSVPAAPAAPSGDPKAAVLAAFKAQLTSGPFRSVTTLLSEGKTTELTAEFVPPSSLHLVVAGEGTQNETVIIGEKMWSKAGEEWTAMPGGGPQVTAMLAEFTQDPESRGVVISNVQYLGPDMVDGTPTWVYSYDTSFGEGDYAVQSQAKLWVGVADGLPLKQESVGSFNGVETSGSARITYDPSLTIAPPVP